MHLGNLRTIWDVLRDLAAFFWAGPLSFLSSFINEDVRFSQIQNRGVVTGHVITLVDHTEAVCAAFQKPRFYAFLVTKD